MQKRKRALTLIEVLVSSVILAITITGLVNIFVSAKRHVWHYRWRTTAGVLGRYVLDPLYLQVRQSEWNPAINDYYPYNLLSKGTKTGPPVLIEDTQYTSTYTVSVPAGFPANSQIRKVVTRLNWTERTP